MLFCLLVLTNVLGGEGLFVLLLVWDAGAGGLADNENCSFDNTVLKRTSL
jgi:hypothetical protein